MTRTSSLLLILLLALALAGGLAWFLLGAGEARRPSPMPVSIRPVDPGEASADATLAASDGSGLAAGEERETQREGATLAEVTTDPEAGASPAADLEDADAWLTGRLVDEAGEPVGGGTIYLAESNTQLAVPLEIEPSAMPSWLRRITTESEPNGRFRFLEAPGRNVRRLRLSAQAAGFRITRLTSLRVDVDGGDIGDVVLRRGVLVRGRVVGPGGAAVSDAELLLATDSPGEGLDLRFPGRGVPLTRTDADGAFAVDGVAPGEFRWIVDGADFLARTVSGDAPTDELLVQLEPGRSIRGKVRGREHVEGPLRVVARPAEVEDEEREFLPPVPRDTLLSRARTGAVGDDGAFEVRGLVSGYDYRLVVERADERDGSGRIEEEEPVRARAGEAGVVIELGARASLTFRVVDADGEPIERFVARFGTNRPRVLRGEDGRLLERHPDGRVEVERDDEGDDYRIQIFSPLYEDLERSGIRLLKGELNELGDLVLEPAAAAILAVRGAGGEPLEGALVVTGPEESVNNWRRRASASSEPRESRSLRFARTDERGLAVLHPRRDELTFASAIAPGHVAGEARPLPGGSLELAQAVEAAFDADGAEADLTLDLEAAASIVVSVVDHTGAPVAGERLVLRQGRRDWRRETDVAGQAEVLDLTPGEYRLSLEEDVEGAEPRVLELRGGERREEEFRAPLRGRVFGVLREGGQPLVAAELILFAAAETRLGWSELRSFDFARRTATTDSRGRFDFEGVATGEHELRIYHASRMMPVRLPVVTQPPETELSLDLELTILGGRVVDEDGAPLEGARVSVTDTAESDGRNRGRGDILGYELREGETGGLDFEPRTLDRPSIRTDADGRFELRGVRGDTELRLSVRKSGYETVHSEAERIDAGVVQDDFEFVLRRAGDIVVRIEGLAADNRQWFIVSAKPVGERRSNASTPTAYLSVRRRASRLRDLAAGRWKLRFSRSLGRGAGSELLEELELDVEPGGEVEHTFRVP